MRNTSILIVEPETRVAADLATKLRELGYEVAGIATDGDEGITLARRFCPDLVLMDIRLEGPAGDTEAAEMIRREQDVPVVYLVVNSDVAALACAKRMEPFGSISKPFRERELVRQIEFELYKHRADRAVWQEHDVLQAVMNGAKNSHLVYLDRNFNFVRVNETYARTCGYTPEQMIGKNHFALYPHEENEEIFTRVRDTGIPAEFHDKPFVFPDQPERGVTYWDWTLMPVKGRSGEVEGLVFSLFETTERKRVEEMLRQLAQFPAENPNPVLRVAATGKLMYANQPANDWLAEFGWRDGDPLPSVIRELVSAAHQKAGVVEVEVASPANSIFWLSAAQPPGEAYVNLYAHDITKRNAAEEALRQSREDLDRAQAVGQIGWWRLDTRKNVLTWSPENHRIFGVPQGTPMSYEFFLSIVHPDDRQYVDTKWQAGLRGKPYDIEHRIVADGKVKWVREKAYLEFDREGELLGGFGITQDITARKRAEEALRESEERLRLATEAAAMFAWECDLPAEIIRWSNNAAVIIGCRPDELPSDVARGRFFVATEDDDRICRDFAEALEERRLTFSTEFCGRGKPAKHFQLHARALYAADGSPLRLLGVTQDITKRKRAEEDIRELSENLAARNAELEAVNKDLESFIYSISHDLRAPVRHMTGFTGILLEDYEDRLDEQGKDYLMRIQTGASKMMRLIDALLRLSRISRQEMVCATVDLSALAQSIVAELKESDPGREITVSVAEGVTAFADMALMEIVLSNLLGNARKFTSKIENARIEFGVMSQEIGERVFYVRDNGAGFNPQHKDRLFRPFQRLHPEKEFAGTGIGLAIVERIIHRHGGRIWAEAEVEQGATIYFTLK